MFDHWRTSFGALLFFGVVACGGVSAPSSLSTPTPPIAAEAHDAAPTPPQPPEALVDGVPQDASWILQLHPRAIAEQGTLRSIMSAIIPDARLDRFARENEVDLRLLDELLIANNHDEPLYLARGAGVDAPYVVDMFGIRLAPIESSAEDPVIRRSGFLARERFEIAALDARTLALTRGTSATLAPAIACRRHDARASCGALAEERALLEAARQSHVVLVARGPWSFPEGSSIAAVLNQVRTSILRLDVQGERLVLNAEFVGEFPDSTEAGVRNLLSTIALSDIGHVLGLQDALGSMRIRVTPRFLTLTLDVDSAVLSEGLRTMFQASLPEIIESL